MKRVTLGIAALTAAALTGLAADSAPLAVDSECGAPRWNRVFTQTVPLTWDWEWRWVPAEAAQVTLRIAGVNNGVAVEQTFQKPVAAYIWDVHAASSDFREDVYEATLTFSDAEGTPLASKAARLNVLAGAFTGAAVTTVATNAAGWKRVRSGALIPYDRTWRLATAFATRATRATLAWTYGGEQVHAADLDAVAAGLHPWRTEGWRKGDYELRLVFDGAPSWTALVSLFPDGTMMLVK